MLDYLQRRHGARFLLVCPPPQKTPIAGFEWQQRRLLRHSETIAHIRRGGRIGLIPYTLQPLPDVYPEWRLTAADFDKGELRSIDAFTSAYPPLLSVNTQTPNHRHLFYIDIRPRPNYNFAARGVIGVGGQIRGDNGYVVLHGHTLKDLYNAVTSPPSTWLPTILFPADAYAPKSAPPRKSKAKPAPPAPDAPPQSKRPINPADVKSAIAAIDIPEWLVSATPGERNAYLFWALAYWAYEQNKRRYSRDDWLDLVHAAAQYLYSAMRFTDALDTGGNAYELPEVSASAQSVAEWTYANPDYKPWAGPRPEFDYSPKRQSARAKRRAPSVRAANKERDRRIIALHIQGKSLRAIAQAVYDEGLCPPRKGKPAPLPSPHTIRRIIARHCAIHQHTETAAPTAQNPPLFRTGSK